MQKSVLIKRIRELTSPIRPQQFKHETKLRPLEGIKCVAFDFYGTMFISGVGDISIDEEQQEAYQPIFEKALDQTGINVLQATPGKIGLQQFEETILRHKNQKKDEGIEYPEPNIIDVWQEVLASLTELNYIEGPVTEQSATRFAVEYEFNANKIWPVPNLKAILNRLLNRGLMLGIISNSQFYTPLAFEALIGSSTDDFGFDPDLQKWSYVQGVKKPSLNFYRTFVQALPAKNLNPQEVLYIGNDLFKDIIPASKLEMRTGLYVGDRRSLRHEKKDLSKTKYKPDIIIDDLHQISDCID